MSDELDEYIKRGSEIWAGVPDNFVSELRGDMKTVKTLGSKMSPADICRANEWGVGTVLCGDKFLSPIIEIISIGVENVMAINHSDGFAGYLRFDCQEWDEVKCD